MRERKWLQSTSIGEWEGQESGIGDENGIFETDEG